MEGLPKLPGMNFDSRLKSSHHVNHCFDMVNGYRIPKASPCGIGNDPASEESVAFSKKYNASIYDPTLTYGRVQNIETFPFQPQFVKYDKKLLTFNAYFKENITEPFLDNYLRYVKIIYFLEDDSITVLEPSTRNSGLPQGRLIRRGKVAKNINGECYHWKDFNIGKDLELNGIVFHIRSCDQFTKEFLTSQGIETQDPNSYIGNILPTENSGCIAQPETKVNPHSNKRRKFLQFQGKALRFNCVLDETDRPNGDRITYELFYYLEDDTVSIKELKENQEGRDRFPMLLRRTKLPKKPNNFPVDFPTIYLEATEKDIHDYYKPEDLKVGSSISVFGRQFFLLDCDNFTRRYYAEILKLPQQEKVSTEVFEKPLGKKPIPDYMGLGTPEDSMASCFRLVPKEPRKNIVKYLLNINKSLRYEIVLDTAHPEDKMRKFILSYSLADDSITITEPPRQNSGIIGGRFVTSQRIPLPDSDRNNPVYYGPKDFFIDAILKINDHRFKIVGADRFVYTYMVDNPELFTTDAVKGVHAFLEKQNLLPNTEEKANSTGKDIPLDGIVKLPIEQNSSSEQNEVKVNEIEKGLQEVMLQSSVKHSPSTCGTIL